MYEMLAPGVSVFANASTPVSVLQNFLAPLMFMLTGLAAVVCTLFIVNAGFTYMTSAGKPDALAHAKHILRNATIGLVIVIGAATITSLLTNAYGAPASGHVTNLPNLEAIPPKPASSGLVEVLINAVTGFLNVIIQAVGSPFLEALNYFTKETPLMVENKTVFNMWLAMVGITNLLFIVVIALVGFHFMSASSLGFDEIEVKHMLPRIGLIFVLVNSSIFLIDGIIELSNVLISAVNAIPGASSPWETLTKVIETTVTQGVAALLLMLAFIVFAVILLVYYVGRLVTLFIGAVLSPLVILAWLIPGFRDFSETAAKTYLTTIFTLFVHVIILTLAASLLSGISTNGSDRLPDTLMALVVGLATIVALLKTQGVMMQFSYVSMGARNSRMLGGQFMNGVSYLTGKGRGAAVGAAHATKRTTSTVKHAHNSRRPASSAKQSIDFTRKDSSGITITRSPEKLKTGTTFEAPSTSVTTSRRNSGAPKNSSKDKVT